MLSSVKGDTSAVLKEAQVEIIPYSICNGSESYGGLVNKNMICAGSRFGGIDACQVRTDTVPHRPPGKPPSQRLRGTVMTSSCSIIH